MDDLDKFCCQNKNCPKHGVRGGGNIHVRAYYGPNKTRLLYCLVCKKRFSEHRGTVFFRCAFAQSNGCFHSRTRCRGGWNAENRAFGEC